MNFEYFAPSPDKNRSVSDKGPPPSLESDAKWLNVYFRSILEKKINHLDLMGNRRNIEIWYNKGHMVSEREGEGGGIEGENKFKEG